MTDPSLRERTTDLLISARGASEEGRKSSEELARALYEELRGMARRHLSRERAGHTLQATDLVHEVYLRLCNQDRLDASDRLRFLGLAARVMRQVLVDHARHRKAQKRGGGGVPVTFVEELHPGERATESVIDILHLEEALEALARLDARAASVVELKVFAGLSRAEIAEHLGVSERTVTGDWSYARRWLQRELG